MSIDSQGIAIKCDHPVMAKWLADRHEGIWGDVWTRGEESRLISPDECLEIIPTDVRTPIMELQVELRPQAAMSQERIAISQQAVKIAG